MNVVKRQFPNRLPLPFMILTMLLAMATAAAAAEPVDFLRAPFAPAGAEGLLDGAHHGGGARYGQPARGD